MSSIHPSHQFLAQSLASVQPGAPCTSYQPNPSPHRWKVVQEAASAKSTRDVGDKAMKKEADRMEEGLTGPAVHKGLRESSDRP